MIKYIQIFYVFIVRFYQKFISPLKGRTCRFYPTCSEYSIQAVQKYGILKGLYISCIRILKCNPLHKGGYDPLD
ncbi:membrane protein insertion efficiency factor YidD [Alkalithermobacter paradoxus]|uniref:Putative membrane protein insertion efficiency factor n=1 Tax=Alkalithermobacter paradoxus TaxID=29349 RepID=A0A1V4I6C3_9FIRM|nr:putative membrane protein insertion efficiency factor [[Clostridium] thermoalcaliphilum]